MKLTLHKGATDTAHPHASAQLSRSARWLTGSARVRHTTMVISPVLCGRLASLHVVRHRCTALAARLAAGSQHGSHLSGLIAARLSKRLLVVQALGAVSTRPCCVREGEVWRCLQCAAMSSVCGHDVTGGDAAGLVRATELQQHLQAKKAAEKAKFDALGVSLSGTSPQACSNPHQAFFPALMMMSCCCWQHQPGAYYATLVKQSSCMVACTPCQIAVHPAHCFH